MGAVAFAASLAAGCANADPAAEPWGVALEVAPLHLEGIDVACYDVRVSSARGIVWQLGEPDLSAADGDTKTICSDRYGLAGGIAYIGPCDAAADDGTSGRVTNQVTVWIDGLYTQHDGALTPISGVWQDPCGAEGCTVPFVCVENADTPVAFDFTILRQGLSGFVDLTVEFEDMLCAAKVDCRYANETPEANDDPVIHLVRDLAGQALPTAVFALSCSGGAGDEGTTRLYLSDVAIDCDGDEHDLEVPVDRVDRVYAEDPPGVVAQAMVFQGRNNLSADDELYWNVGVALAPSDESDPLAPLFPAKNCVLRATATAASGDIDAALAGANASYPYITAEVALTDGEGALVCGEHPINGGNGVASRYTELGGPLPPEIIWEMSPVDGGVSVGSYPHPAP